MRFTMPDFPRDGRTIDENHTSLLNAHGLLHEGAPNLTVEMAEAELARIMPSYTFGNTKVEVGPKKYKTASLVWGLHKLQHQRLAFRIHSPRVDIITSFLTDAVIYVAKAKPGEHLFVDYVLDCIKQQKPIELGVNLADVA